jgi:hypothetical protein
MTCRRDSGNPSARRLASAFALFALVASAGCVAMEPAPDTGDIAALESVFWHCDYLATTEGVLATPMAACQFATSELKARKFGGSYRALAAWWQENKDAEHGRLGRAAQK